MSAPVSRPDAGLEDLDAALAQGGDVGPGGRVLPHLGVHRRGEQHRAAGGEQRGGQQVVGQPVGGAGQQVGGGRGDDDEVGLAAEPDVRHLVRRRSQTSVLTGWPDSAAQVGAPTNSQRRRGWARRVTSCPVSVSRRSSDTTLYAAMPPPTPRTTRGVGWPGLRLPSDGRAQASIGSEVSRPSLISRSAIDSGFSCTWVSTSGPTYSSRPSPSWE